MRPLFLQFTLSRIRPCRNQLARTAGRRSRTSWPRTDERYWGSSVPQTGVEHVDHLVALRLPFKAIAYTVDVVLLPEEQPWSLFLNHSLDLVEHLPPYIGIDDGSHSAQGFLDFLVPERDPRSTFDEP